MSSLGYVAKPNIPHPATCKYFSKLDSHCSALFTVFRNKEIVKFFINGCIGY